MQEFGTDPPIEPDTPRHILNITAQLLAEISHFVDESDLGGEKRIRRIFDDFRGLARGEEDRCLVEIERTVELP